MFTPTKVISTLFYGIPATWTPPKPKPKWVPPPPKPNETFSLFSYDIIHYHDAF